MKRFKLISVLLVIFIIMFVVAGCSNKEDNTKETAQQTTAADTKADSTAPSTAEHKDAQTDTHADTNTEQPEETEPFYTRESDELEILTPDAGDNSGDNTPEPAVTDPSAQENTTGQSAETFPDLDDIIDEPIELPFVPID